MKSNLYHDLVKKREKFIEKNQAPMYDYYYYCYINKNQLYFSFLLKKYECVNNYLLSNK